MTMSKWVALRRHDDGEQAMIMASEVIAVWPDDGATVVTIRGCPVMMCVRETPDEVSRLLRNAGVEF